MNSPGVLQTIDAAGIPVGYTERGQGFEYKLGGWINYLIRRPELANDQAWSYWAIFWSALPGACQPSFPASQSAENDRRLESELSHHGRVDGVMDTYRSNCDLKRGWAS